MSCQNFHGQSDGWYTIFTNKNKMAKVYCQFDSMNVWTLVMSYSFKFRAPYRDRPYYENFPRNEMNETWEDHRLSFDAMKSIKEDGNTLWRITCSYGDKGWNETDLVIATHKNAPIFQTFITPPPVCLNVRYINIRGYNCKDCSVPFWQYDVEILHLDSSSALNYCNKKDFKSTSCTGEGGEDNFGYYKCYNAKHRCSSSNNATTQLWFGQQMKYIDE
ncbi:uncharacterized protein LOC124457740 [Xenia sp. Carnegie-2017]|uniref:uncharacterized protein LOC124457740 n=1 Tax=Xenia sp. Carnegie-2017 TaxID=2897299 RepID=UPI001F04AA91|nr:uncharacterized protein LOC124457740 [Xenia sp. Carnegie-2017]